MPRNNCTQNEYRSSSQSESQTLPSLFTSVTSTQCAFNIIPSNLEGETDKSIEQTPQNNTHTHFHSKHKYRDAFGDAQIWCHNFDNGDATTYKDKYVALLQQELQNPNWCLHDPVTTKSYQIWTLRQYHMLCIFQAILKQSPILIMSHIKPYSK